MKLISVLQVGTNKTRCGVAGISNHTMSSPKVNPDVKRLTEAMIKYTSLFETCSQCVRSLPNRSQLYNEAVEKWKDRSEFYRPRRGDEGVCVCVCVCILVCYPACA